MITNTTAITLLNPVHDNIYPFAVPTYLLPLLDTDTLSFFQSHNLRYMSCFFSASQYLASLVRPGDVLSIHVASRLPRHQFKSGCVFNTLFTLLVHLLVRGRLLSSSTNHPAEMPSTKHQPWTICSHFPPYFSSTLAFVGLSASDRRITDHSSINHLQRPPRPNPIAQWRNWKRTLSTITSKAVADDDMFHRKMLPPNSRRKQSNMPL